MMRLGRPLVLAGRGVAQRPWLAFGITAIVALGAGTVATAFAVADPIILRPLPYPEPRDLIQVRTQTTTDFDDPRLNLADLQLALDSSRTLSLLSAYNAGPAGYVDGIDRKIVTARVTENFLPLLGVHPAVGRSFHSSEFRSGAQVCLVSHDVSRLLGGQQGERTRWLSFEGVQELSCEIVGVLPITFRFPNVETTEPAVLLPLASTPMNVGRVAGQVNILARLRPDVGTTAAKFEMQEIVRGAEQQYPKLGRSRQVEVLALQRSMYGTAREPALLILAVTAAVLLLAAANLSQLYMTHLRERAHDLSLRLCLGAEPRHLWTSLLLEAGLLTAAAAAGALGLTLWLSHQIAAHVPDSLYVYAASLDASSTRTLTIILGSVVVATALCLGLPIWRTLRTISPASVQSGRGIAQTSRSRHRDLLLVTVQLAASFVITSVGLLAVQSYQRAVDRPVGFRYAGLHVLQPQPPREALQDEHALAETNWQIYRQLQSQFGPRVALSLGLPSMSSAGSLTGSVATDAAVRVPYIRVSGTFFQVTGIALVRGRLFDESEAFGAASVAVVDEKAAALLAGDVEPLGLHVRDEDGSVRTIVGIVQTLRRDLLGEVPPRGYAFVPIGRQMGDLVSFSYRPDQGVPTGVIRRSIAQVAPKTRIDPAPLRPFRRQIVRQEFFALLFAFLAMVALSLMAASAFSVTAQHVAGRSGELAVRAALGASPGRLIRRLWLEEALIPTVGGIVIGLVVAGFWGAVVHAILFMTPSGNPSIFAIAGGLLASLISVAAVVPAAAACRRPLATVLRGGS
jgi:predicted permease